MIEPSREKQLKTIKQKYGDDYYSNLAKKRWQKPGAKEQIKHDKKGRFTKINLEQDIKQ